MKDLLLDWKDKIFIVKPETVIKWHRTAFRTYWRRKSRHNGGRPKLDREVIDLIRQIANENPLWGVPRIHGELKKIGFKISQSLFKDIFQNGMAEQQVRDGKHFLRTTRKKSYRLTSLQFQQ